jgi:putative molybdopterin biosynthesis protein
MTLTAPREDYTPLLRPAEAAARLSVTRKPVYRLIERGDLPAVHVGRQLRIDPSALHDYLRAGSRR